MKPRLLEAPPPPPAIGALHKRKLRHEGTPAQLILSENSYYGYDGNSVYPSITARYCAQSLALCSYSRKYTWTTPMPVLSGLPRTWAVY